MTSEIASESRVSRHLEVLSSDGTRLFAQEFGPGGMLHCWSLVTAGPVRGGVSGGHRSSSSRRRIG